jgi:hypothetical protein
VGIITYPTIICQPNEENGKAISTLALGENGFLTEAVAGFGKSLQAFPTIYDKVNQVCDC